MANEKVLIIDEDEEEFPTLGAMTWPDVVTHVDGVCSRRKAQADALRSAAIQASFKKQKPEKSAGEKATARLRKKKGESEDEFMARKAAVAQAAEDALTRGDAARLVCLHCAKEWHGECMAGADRGRVVCECPCENEADRTGVHPESCRCPRTCGGGGAAPTDQGPEHAS